VFAAFSRLFTAFEIALKSPDFDAFFAASLPRCSPRFTKKGLRDDLHPEGLLFFRFLFGYMLEITHPVYVINEPFASGKLI
jgi:hypothetical protein